RSPSRLALSLPQLGAWSSHGCPERGCANCNRSTWRSRSAWPHQLQIASPGEPSRGSRFAWPCCIARLAFDGALALLFRGRTEVNDLLCVAGGRLPKCGAMGHLVAPRPSGGEKLIHLSYLPPDAALMSRSRSRISTVSARLGVDSRSCRLFSI